LKEFGSYGNGDGEFDCLAGVAINRIGQFIIADRYNHRIQVFDPAGKLSLISLIEKNFFLIQKNFNLGRFLRTFGSQGTTDGKFNYPWGITTDSMGFIYVCDKENHRIQVFQSDGTFVGKFGQLGNGEGQLVSIKSCYSFMQICSRDYFLGTSSLHSSFKHESGHCLRLKQSSHSGTYFE
jgi:tripartite motif-containing protein 71